MKKTLTLIIAVLMTASFTSVFAADSQNATQTELTQAKKKKAEVKEVTFKVHLHCEKCVAKVMDNISRAKGVKDLHVCLEDQIVSIKYDSAKTNEATLQAAIEKLGYKVHGKAEHGHNHAH